ncbi:hypothetical protein D9M71_697630 [compost metagenome]
MHRTDRQHRGQAGADAVTADCHPGGVQIQLGGVFQQPVGAVQAILHCGRKRVLRRQPIIWREHGKIARQRQAPAHRIV